MEVIINHIVASWNCIFLVLPQNKATVWNDIYAVFHYSSHVTTCKSTKNTTLYILDIFKLHSKKNALLGELEQITYVSKVNLLHTEYRV